jgi:hypothetical protein
MAAYILIAMKSGKTGHEIKKDILDKYDIGAEQLERDWEDWMIQLKEANLLETEG